MTQIIYRSKLGMIVYPYTKSSCYILDRETSFYDKVYHKNIPYAGFILPYGGKNSFITYNRDLDKIRSLYPTAEIVDLPEIRPKKMSERIQLTGIKSLKPAQREVLDSIAATTKTDNVWFVNIQTGEGKTVLATFLSTQLNLKTWVMVFSDVILDQWCKTYTKNTTIDPKKILRVTGPVIDRIMAGKIDPDDYDIFVSTPLLLSTFGERRSDFDKIRQLFEKCGIGFLIFDEAHRHVGNLIKINAVANVRYQLYLSADYGQGDYKKEYIFKDIFKHVPVLTATEETQRSMKYTKPIIVEFNTYPNSIEAEEPFSRYGFNAELYLKYEFKKGILLEAIMHMLKIYADKDSTHRTLILFSNIEFLEIAYQSIKQRFPHKKVGRFYGELSKEEKEKTKETADIIVATYSSFSTGIDTKNIKYIHSTNQCNKIQDNQSAGRSRPLADGSDAFYFMYIDKGIPYCNKKLKTRLNYLMKTKLKGDTVYRYIYHPAMHKGEN